MFNSRLWKRTLAERSEDPARVARERLRSAYLSFRERAGMLAGEIARDLPEFTVHDLTHLDALWEMGDLVTPDSFELTPSEAFVLGSAILIHDLGMGVAAYSDGVKELRATPTWGDALASIRQEEGAYPMRYAELSALERRADAVALRSLHARHAERLCGVTWTNGGRSYGLLEDSGLREAFGAVVGRIAHSHWWPTSELPLGLPPLIGACTWMPEGWTVDPVKVACLLRVADAAHIDARRAPTFLMALRKFDSSAKVHWDAQSRLQKPLLRHDRLLYTAGSGFGVEQADAWWTCYDLLAALNKELREVDQLLLDTGRSVLAAKGVLGIDHPERLAQYIPPIGWKPIDAQVRISDVPALIEKLGGRALYGNRPEVALRELIQNATDAVRARRILEGRPANWGEVVVRLRSEGGCHVLEVEDSGIGMSARTLASTLLDFGSSYWWSDAAREEHPGLASKGFVPTGRFGIGFYSVFMISDSVAVASRRVEEGPRDTHVLEFREGLRRRPILRKADAAEFLREPGTIVRAVLRLPPHEKGGLLFAEREGRTTIEEFVARLAPAVDVDLHVDDRGAKGRAVRARDWLDLPPSELILRGMGLDRRGSVHEAKEVAAKNAGRLRDVVAEHGEVVGRACIPVEDVDDVSYVSPRASVVVGGLDASHVPLWGLFVGACTTASRSDASPIASAVSFKKWAEEQVSLLEAATDTPPAAIFEAAAIACGFGAPPGSLPIAKARRGWMNAAAIERLAAKVDVLVLTEAGPLHLQPDEVEDEAAVILDAGVLATSTLAATAPCSIDGLRWESIEELPPDDHAGSMNGTLAGVAVGAIARGWHAPVAEVVASSQFSSEEEPIWMEIGNRRRKRLEQMVYVILRRPPGR